MIFEPSILSLQKRIAAAILLNKVRDCPDELILDADEAWTQLISNLRQTLDTDASSGVIERLMGVRMTTT